MLQTMKSSVLVFQLLMIVNNAHSYRFLVDVADYIPSHAILVQQRHAVRVRCVGTVISTKHVLTTAECSTVDEPLAIVVLIRAVILNPLGHGSVSETKLSPAESVFIHPKHFLGEEKFNIAVIVTAGVSRMDPMSLSYLVPNKTHVLFESRKVFDNPLKQRIIIYDSEFCGLNSQETFCSTVSSADDAVCYVYPGTPISRNSGFIDGILISNRECTPRGDHFMLKYISLGEHLEWIKKVSGTQSASKISLVLLLPLLILDIYHLLVRAF